MGAVAEPLQRQPLRITHRSIGTRKAIMPRGEKSKYTDKQQRKAEHIEQSYEARGVPEGEAEARAWATVNKQSGGGERKGGSGQKKSETAKQADRKDSAHRAAKARSGDSPNKRSARNDRSSSTSLTELTRDELMQRARERDIRGRSKMRKDDLIKALS
jgi:plasmid stabilization system protein ParE